MSWKIYLIMFQFYLELQIRSERSLAYVLCISTCQMALIIIMETKARLCHEVYKYIHYVLNMCFTCGSYMPCSPVNKQGR